MSDIERLPGRVKGILKVEAVDRPKTGLVGFKWRETRKLFGKEATAVMWITDAKAPSHYEKRGEERGVVYTTRIGVSSTPDGSRLTMYWQGIPQAFGAKVMLALMAPLIKSATRKALRDDLADIKAAVEAA